MNTTRPLPMRPPAAPPEVLEALRRRIAELRAAAGLTARALSLAAGLSPAAVGLIESGRSTPALGTLAAVAAALGRPLADLFAAPARPPKKSRKNPSPAIDTDS